MSPITFIVTFRGDHRSVQVGFVPNPRPTKPNRVKNFQTRYRPVRDSGWIRWFFAGRWSGLGWGRIWPKLTGSSLKLDRSGRNSIDLVEILRIWPKTSLLWQDLIRSKQISKRSCRISTRSYRISMRSHRIWQDPIEKLCRRWRSVAFLVVELVRSVEIGFRCKDLPIDLPNLGWVPRKPPPTHHYTWIGRFSNRVGRNLRWVGYSICLGQI